jgi:hypothetical protein
VGLGFLLSRVHGRPTRRVDYRCSVDEIMLRYRMEWTDGLLKTWWERGQLAVVLVLVISTGIAILLR